MRFRKVAIFLGMAFIAILGLSYKKPPNAMPSNVYDSSISGDFFAIPFLEGDSSIVLGRSSDGFRIRIESNSIILNPTVLEDGTLLFVEATPQPAGGFYLLKLSFSDQEIMCHRIAFTKDFIGGPTAIDEPESDRTLFFTGQFYPNSGGNNLPRRQLAEYHDGKVTVFDGPTFSTMESIVKVDDGKYLGVSYSIEPPLPGYNESSYIDLKENSWLANVNIGTERITAVPDFLGKLKIDYVSSIAALPNSAVIAVKSADYSTDDPAREKVTLVEKTSGEVVRSFLLPAGFLFSNPSLSISRDNFDIPTIKFMATNNLGEVFIMSFAPDASITSEKIDLETSNVFNVEKCASDGMVHF